MGLIMMGTHVLLGLKILKINTIRGCCELTPAFASGIINAGTPVQKCNKNDSCLNHLGGSSPVPYLSAVSE